MKRQAWGLLLLAFSLHLEAQPEEGAGAHSCYPGTQKVLKNQELKVVLLSIAKLNQFEPWETSHVPNKTNKR